MSRRGQGEGTISKRADGRWEARISLGDGKRKIYYGKTRKEVADKLTQGLRDKQQGLPVISRPRDSFDVLEALDRGYRASIIATADVRLVFYDYQ